MLKAVFFDMDGVVADTEPLHFIALQRLMKEKGHIIPASSLPEYIGLSEQDIWLRARELGIKDKFSTFERKRRQHFFDAINGLKPSIGLLELLSELKKGNIRLGIVTSSGNEIAEMLLTKLRVIKNFEIIVTADDVEYRKPDAEPYLLASQRLGVSLNEAVAIEDSAHGISSAKAAGILTIALDTYHNRKNLARADLIVGSLEELSLKKIEELYGKKRD